MTTFDELKSSCNLKGRTNLFFIYFSCWILLILLTLMTTDKYTSFTVINHFRSYPGDLLFTFFTILGNGTVLIPLAALLLFRKNYPALIGLLLSILLNTLIVGVLKHFFNHPRPLACYGEDIVQTASWIKLYTRYSFPSGHTASAFCMAAYLSLSYSNDRRVSGIAFVCAVLTGYSRVYLGEHFLEDIWLGSIVGVFTAAATYVFVQYYVSRIINAFSKRPKQ